MRTRRILTAWAVFLAVTGGLGATIGYGTYHRGELYRRKIERQLADFFGLPADVGYVRPRTFTSRELGNLQFWLPGRRDRIFQAPGAVLEEGAEGNGGTLVILDRPLLTIGSEAWEQEDYIQVLRASLAHNFRELDVNEIRLVDARIVWPRRDFHLSVEGVEGNILFDADGRGEARLASRRLNGISVGEPVQIVARIDPLSDDLLPEVTLAVPPLPLHVLGLHQVLGSAITQGTFAGRITLYQSADGDSIRLSGSAAAVKLEELTGRIASGPVSAVFDLNIEEALLRGKELERMVFRGEIRQLNVQPLLSRLGLGGVGGQARLTVRDARLVGEGIEHLAFSGEWLGAAVDPLVKLALGRGGLAGRLQVRVHSLVIRDNQLAQADADVQVLPPEHGPGKIERGLLLALLENQAGLSIPERLLPEWIEFTQMSARLSVDGQRLRILSTRGPAGPPVITARIGGIDLPLLAELDQSFDLALLQKGLKARIAQWRSAVRERISARRSASRPASEPLPRR